MRKQEEYYVAIRPHNGGVCISRSKVIIAKFLGISDDTVSRRLKDVSHYERFAEYELYSGITIERIKRGTAIKR